MGRDGVERMEQLCALQRAGPERLLELRSIGAKSLPLIAAVCARYEENRTTSQGGARLRQLRYAARDWAVLAFFLGVALLVWVLGRFGL